MELIFKLTALLSSNPKKSIFYRNTKRILTFLHKMIYLVNRNPLHVDSIWYINQQQTIDQNNVLKNIGHQPHFHVITLQT